MRPTKKQIDAMLGELLKTATYICQNHVKAMARNKKVIEEGADAEKDGYPTCSLPESEIHSGHTSDPTSDYVVRLAGGEDDSRDRWKAPKDPIGDTLEAMNGAVVRALKQLRLADGYLRDALPTKIPDPVREECKKCWMSKNVATNYGENPKGWVVGESMCASCSRRSKRRGMSIRTRTAAHA
jgi:hypothetical protein